MLSEAPDAAVLESQSFCSGCTSKNAFRQFAGAQGVDHATDGGEIDIAWPQP